MSNAEDTLVQLVVDRVNANKSLLNVAYRGTSPEDKNFDTLPSVLIWWHVTNYPVGNSVKSGSGVKIINKILWQTEYPIVGALIFGNNQSEALFAMEEFKLIVSGFYPTIATRDVQYPLHPIHFAVPFVESEVFCIGMFFELEWQYQNNVVGM